MITDENDPMMRSAATELSHRVSMLCLNRRYDNTLSQKLRDLLYDHHVRWKLRGVDFPTMTPLAVPEGLVYGLHRADMDIAGIRIIVVNFVRAHPELTPLQVASAVRTAWPQLKTGDLVGDGSMIKPTDVKRLN